MKRCKNGCCQYIVNNNYRRPFGPWKIQKKKAGIINYWYDTRQLNISKLSEPNEQPSVASRSKAAPTLYFLLVNSSGWKWGFPKGSIEEGETPLNGAIREYIEETGLKLDKEDLIKDGNTFLTKSSNRVKYYFTNKKGKIIPITSSYPYNDSTGIGIFNYECLQSGNLGLELNLSCEKIISGIIDESLDLSLGKLTI